MLDGYVIVWINAFIPRDVHGYTKLIARGQFMGKTAVPLPPVANLRLYNLLKPTGTGYLTDQRAFSSEIGTSVRMQSIARITLYPPTLVQHYHLTSGTREVNIATGEDQGGGTADMSDCWTRGVWDVTETSVWDRTGRLPLADHGGAFHGSQRVSSFLEHLANRRPSRGQMRDYYILTSLLRPIGARPIGWPVGREPKAGQPYAMLLRVHGEASDPLVGGAANIDYTVDFLISVENSRVLVGVIGLIDQFPAFEAYANFNGATKALFRIPPAQGNTVVDLVGSESEPVAAAVAFP